MIYGTDNQYIEFFNWVKFTLKIPTGIEAIECMFSLIKIIHTARRASLGPKKLRDLIYTVGNYRVLKHFK